MWGLLNCATAGGVRGPEDEDRRLEGLGATRADGDAAGSPREVHRPVRRPDARRSTRRPVFVSQELILVGIRRRTGRDDYGLPLVRVLRLIDRNGQDGLWLVSGTELSGQSFGQDAHAEIVRVVGFGRERGAGECCDGSEDSAGRIRARSSLRKFWTGADFGRKHSTHLVSGKP